MKLLEFFSRCAMLSIGVCAILVGFADGVIDRLELIGIGLLLVNESGKD